MKNKKLIAILTLLCFMFTFVPVAVFAEEPPANWIDSADTTWYDASKNEFTIDTAAELAGLASLVNNNTETFSGKKVILGADIDLSGKEWTPIGTASYTFGGEFDGKDYTISNITNTSTLKHKGLFARARSCYIHNVKVNGVNFSCNEAVNSVQIGGFSGGGHNTAVVKDITVSNVVINYPQANGSYFSGFAGEAWMYSQAKGITIENVSITVGNNGSNTNYISGFTYKSEGQLPANVNANKTYYLDEQNSALITDFTDSTGNQIMTGYYDNVDIKGFTVNASGKSNIAGFVGYTNANGNNFFRAVNCDVTGFDITVFGSDAVTVGGFIADARSGEKSNHQTTATIVGKPSCENCTVTGSIKSTATSTDSIFGGFVAVDSEKAVCSRTFKDCTANVDIDATAGTVGGMQGVAHCLDSGQYLKFDNCKATGTVKTGNGLAGGLIGEGKYCSNNSHVFAITIENDCAFIGTVTGTLTNQIANLPGGYAINTAVGADANMIVSSDAIGTKTVGEGENQKTYYIGYAADSNNIINFPDGTFTVPENHIASNTGEIDGITLTIGDEDVLLAAPALAHHIFLGWCSGSNEENYATTNSSYQWVANAGATYHAHWQHSSYEELEYTDLHRSFITTYGASSDEVQTVTFKPATAGENHAVTNVESGNYFDANKDTTDPLTVVITPKADVTTLNAGTYVDTIHVTMEDKSVHFITVTLLVEKQDSAVTAWADNTTVAYGDSITLNAAVTENGNAANAGNVKFYCGDTLLGNAVVNENGTATLTYNTANGGLKVGSNEVVAVYGGSANFNESQSAPIAVTVYKTEDNGSITVGGVTVAPSEGESAAPVTPDASGDVTIGSGSSITINTPSGNESINVPENVEATVPVDKLEEITVTDGTIVLPEGSTVTVGGNSFTVESGMVIVNADGSVTIPVGTELTQNGMTQSYPYGGIIAANGTVTANKAPSTGTSSGGGFSGTYNYPVSVPTADNGKVFLSDNNASAGETVVITTAPNNGYGVAEVIVTDAKGNVIPVTNLGGGKYSFVMPAGKVSVTADFKPAITLTVGSTTANVFGKTVINDVAPIIVDGRTMLPIRFIAEALGADVSWNADTQTVTITKDGTVVQIIIGADYAYINGKKVTLDAKAFIANGRTYLPVRFISEALGADVNWDADAKQVVIMK